MRTHARLLVLALIAVLAGAVAAPTAMAKRPLYGVQGPTVTSDMTAARADAIAKKVAGLHAKVMRVEVLWSLLEPEARGVRDPGVVTAIDRVVDAAAKRKLKVLLMVDSTPCWASTAPAASGGCSGAARLDLSITRYPPSDPTAYADVAAYLVDRYRGKLAAFEVWNEPDQSNEIYWAGPNKVRGYVALARAAYPRLKAVDRKLTVLAGAFVGADGRWLEAMYKAGIKGSYDALSVHFYDLTLYALRATRKVQRANHDNKPLWLAEFGFTSCWGQKGVKPLFEHTCLSRSGQARALTDTLRGIAKVGWVKAGIVFDLADSGGPWQFGLYRTDGKAKPSAGAVKRAFLARKGAVRRPTLRLTSSRGRLVAGGTGSFVDVYSVDVRSHGQLRYRANLRVDRAGRYKLTMPRAVPSSGVRVTVRGSWGGSVTRSR
jgi:hypothetical protein